jgi:hypothetical protein
MAAISALTVKTDEPSQVFWDNYGREMRHKLAEAQEKQSWWRALASSWRPWTLPAFGAAAVVILALTLTLGKDLWRAQDEPPADPSLMEALPMAENLEFFRTMEVLDAMDFLEYLSRAPNGSA